MVLPDDYLIVWADEDGNQGSNHANFKLSNLGEIVILSNSDSTIIDSISFPTQNEDISFGRSPNGYEIFTMLTPTFKKVIMILPILSIVLIEIISKPILTLLMKKINCKNN